MNNRQGLLRAGIVATAVIAGLLASGGMVLRGTEAVFTSTADNAANAWTAGSVNLTTTGTAMFTAPNYMVPGGTPVVRCITVTYNGTVTAPVKLYASASTGASNVTTDLGNYLDLTVVEGTATDTTGGACTGFSAGGTVFPTGTLDTFALKNGYGTGVGTWAPTGTGQTKVYQFTAQLKGGAGTPNTAMGMGATATFTWEAQAGT